MASNTAFTGDIPKIYDRYLGSLLFHPFAMDLSERAGKENFTSVLELATGTGIVTKYLQKVFNKNVRIVASDLNPDMLEIAKKKIKAKNLEWKAIDMQDIPFEDNTFDLVVCQFGIMFVPDKPKAYSEIYRVLRPGGKFLFNTWNKISSNKVAFHTNKVVNSFFKDNPITFYQVPFSYCNKDEISDDLKKAGFKNVKIKLLKKEGSSNSASDAAKGLIGGNPVLASIIERDLKLVSVIQNKLEKIFTEKFGRKNIQSKLQAFVCEAVK